ncbi:hypothetical protein [Nocardioides gansuensis]|nr:hypothetical protein [Nocardioides gansuensis]
MSIAKGGDQRVFVPHQVVKVGEGRLWELDDELVHGLAHGDRLWGRRAYP